MASQLLNLPINIPWCQLGVSENMMDIRVGTDKFPAPWRSSIALSVYEPPIEDLPSQYANKIVTYVKASCSITGYQPSKKEQEEGQANLDDRYSDFRFLWEEYLGCYGVLLNISVLPAKKDDKGNLNVGGKDLSLYPHIVGLEPKNRDLYQAATESGEILTASRSAVQTDKTSVSTNSSESGIQAGFTSAANKGGPNALLSQKWGSSENDSTSTQTDSSRERRETEGTTTQLSQMYNLLTGYHQGTNRTTFLMLPRPHVLQPTNRRTFVQGLRAIEGIQEFFLVVERPREVSALCIESFLETGHYPEDVSIVVADGPSDKIPHEVMVGPIRFAGKKTLNVKKELDYFFENGYSLDLREGEGPFDEVDEPADNLTTQNVGEDYSISVEGTTFVLKGTLKTALTKPKTYHRRFIIHFKKSLTEEPEARVEMGGLLITKRGLSVCFESSNPCKNIINDENDLINEPEAPEVPAEYEYWSLQRSRSQISGEAHLSVHPEAIRNIDSNPAALTNEVLRSLRKALTANNTRYEQFTEGVGFMDTDYFANRVKTRLSEKTQNITLSQLPELAIPEGSQLLTKMTIGYFLSIEFSDLLILSKLSSEDAQKLRQQVLKQSFRL